MIDHTQSYKRAKQEQQKIWDFALLICHAVPALKKTIKGVEESVPRYSLPTPDYFGTTANKERLKAIAKHYNYNIGKYIFLSVFSFFESYVRSVIQELVDFHGGQENFINHLVISDKRLLQNQDAMIVAHKKKLQVPFNEQKWQKYRKHSEILSCDPNFRFPCELFALYGLKRFMQDTLGDNFQSVMIPDILRSAFHMDLSEKMNMHQDLVHMDIEQTFDSARKIRNAIAHGDEPTIGLKKVVAYSDFFRKLTIRIDKHLITHYFIIEQYM